MFNANGIVLKGGWVKRRAKEYNNNEHFCYEWNKKRTGKKNTEMKKQKIKKTVGKCTLCMIAVHSRKLV